MAKILSKFGEQQLVMVNYTCGIHVDNTLLDVQNYSSLTKDEFNNSFIIISKYFQTLKDEKELFVFLLTKNNTTSSQGFLVRQLSNCSRPHF